MPNTNTTIPSARVPLLEAATGLMAREWYRFFGVLFARVGGVEGINGDYGDIEITDGGLSHTIVPGAVDTEKLGGDITDEGIAVLTHGAIAVGGLYLTLSTENPADDLGYGTWSEVGAGRVLVGYDSGDSDFDDLGGTGGAKTVAAAGTNSAPTISGSTGVEAQAPVTVTAVGAVNVSPAAHTHSAGTLAASAPVFTGSATSVVQPYLVCHIWTRTA